MPPDSISVEYEPLGAKWRADPYPVYRELRDRDPVHWAPESACYCVSRYDDVLFVLKNPKLFSSRAMFTVLMNGGEEDPPPLTWEVVKFIVRYVLRARMNPFAFPNVRNLIAEDAPVHGPMRNIVNRGFTPRRIAAWEPRIREIAAQLLAGLDEGGSFDVVRDLAIPLPVAIIAEMVGVEPERTADFKRWSDAVILGATGSRRANRFHPETVKTILELHSYLRKIIRQRRRKPADDLVSALIETEPGGEALSDIEIVTFVQLLLIAGNETTTNLIGNAATALLDHPAELERVARDPALVPALVEEVLRYDAPIQMVFRKARCDVELAGTAIPEGAVVTVLIGSANRDERCFEKPDRFDVGRNPKAHLGFGFGQHFCLGASLARLEARVALEGLVPALVSLERCSDEPALVDSFLVRGPRQLELRPAA